MPAKGKFSIVILDSSMQCFLTCLWFPQHNSAKFPTPLIATLLQVATSTGTSFVFSLLVNPQHFVSSFSQKMTSKQYICQEKKRKKKREKSFLLHFFPQHGRAFQPNNMLPIACDIGNTLGSDAKSKSQAWHTEIYIIYCYLRQPQVLR